MLFRSSAAVHVTIVRQSVHDLIASLVTIYCLHRTFATFGSVRRHSVMNFNLLIEINFQVYSNTPADFDFKLERYTLPQTLFQFLVCSFN